MGRRRGRGGLSQYAGRPAGQSSAGLEPVHFHHAHGVEYCAEHDYHHRRGPTLFATLGGTEEMTTVLWLAVALLFGGALLFGSMHAGSRHEAAPPVPKVD